MKGRRPIQVSGEIYDLLMLRVHELEIASGRRSSMGEAIASFLRPPEFNCACVGTHDPLCDVPEGSPDDR